MEHPWMPNSICRQPGGHLSRYVSQIACDFSIRAGCRTIHQHALQSMDRAFRKLVRKMIRPPASVGWSRPWHEIIYLYMKWDIWNNKEGRIIWILGPANVWDNIETLAYTLQVCRPGSVVFCVGAYLAAVVWEFFLAQTTGQLKRYSFTKQNLPATYRGFCYVLQYYWLGETLVPRFLACTFCLPAPKGAASGHAGAHRCYAPQSSPQSSPQCSNIPRSSLQFANVLPPLVQRLEVALDFLFHVTYHRSTIIVATL